MKLYKRPDSFFAHSDFWSVLHLYVPNFWPICFFRFCHILEGFHLHYLATIIYGFLALLLISAGTQPFHSPAASAPHTEEGTRASLRTAYGDHYKFIMSFSNIEVFISCMGEIHLPSRALTCVTLPIVPTT